EVCEVCHGEGRFICCDACPKVYHLLCLNPPLREPDVRNSDESWYCYSCRPVSNSFSRKPSTLFDPLLKQLDTMSPTVFSLPSTLIHEFQGVAVGPHGEYRDVSKLRPPRTR
ncbi:hypothetical protein BJ085DRAFT_4099, partial [Dimargaris cristalligena]